MPLILAIEPDRQQAAQLASIARGRIGAELVLADSAERALREVGDRIPDLILTPQLLSPRDDAAITNRLRQLGTAAAYVQTLTIPSLATNQPGAQARARGLLSKLRRQKAPPADAPNGCAPDVFADQISVYRDRAPAARTAQAAAEQPPARVESQPVAPIEAATAILDQFVSQVTEPAIVAAPLYIDVAPEPVVADGGFGLEREEAVSSESNFRLQAEATEDRGFAPEPVVASSGFRLQPEDEPREAPPLYLDVAPEPVVAPPAERASDSMFRPKARAREEKAPEVVLAPTPVATPNVPVHVESPKVEEVKTAAGVTRPMDAIVEPVLEIVPEPVLAPEPVVVPAAIVAAEIVEQPRPSKPAKPAAKKKARPAPPKNDWNFFDPEETRFAALLARLDEITRHDAAQQAQRPQA